MSLNGNLEDLPLLDILQIVSFSKKTGYLSIRVGQDEGAIVFRDGFVVACFTWSTGLVDARLRELAPEQRVVVLRQRIERALEQLIRLREGQFSFSLTDETPRTIGARDITEETLPRGINPQELLLDLARGMDEDRRDSTAALEASFAEPEAAAVPAGPQASSAPGPEPAAAPPLPAAAAPAASDADGLGTVLLVDDEDEVRRILAEHLTRGGYNVVEADEPDSAVKKAGRLAKASIPFVLVTDLGMPTSGGSSFHGGFEVVKRLWKMNLRPPVLLMAETLSGAMQARARQMEISHFVFKPGLSKLDPDQFEADLRAFAGKILSDMMPRLAAGGTASARAHPTPAPGPPRPSAPGGAPAGAEPPPPAAPPAPPPPPRTAEETAREYEQLQRWLAELREPKDATQVSTLVMKVARACFERAALFVVKNESMRGLGGFGAAPREEKLGLLVREVVIPLAEPSIFARVALGRKPYAGTWPDEKWARHLLGKVGRFQSSGFALLPLLTNRETVAVLFGDNPDTGRPLGRLDTLETFVNQAGIALENAFLQRKVHAMQTQ